MGTKSTKKNRRPWLKWVILAVVIIGIVAGVAMRRPKDEGPEQRTDVVRRGMVTASVSANGVLRPVTTVEVKSNVGGQVMELFVDEGDVVKAGQVIAKIDPSDSVSNLQQSLADLQSASAKVQQSQQGLKLQRIQTATSIAAAEQALEAEKQRLAQAEKQAQVQPKLTVESIRQAESSYASAQASLRQMKNALVPQKLASSKAGYEQAKASYDKSSNDLQRKRALLEKGFISKSQLEASEEAFSVASAQLESAKSKYDTVKDESDQDLSSAEAKLAQAAAALETAKANRVQDDIRKQELAAAKASVKKAEASLESARAAAFQNQMKEEDIVQARAQLQRVNATVKNAQTQVGYTTIVAPSSGVVVKKYVEVGSIVTAGRSSFAGSGSGVALVEVADINRMMVEVDVDETDIGQIRVGQRVDVSVDAYPDARFAGKVTKIAPKAVMEQNVTTIPVTVEIERPDHRLKPEMNATCDFIIARKPDVLMVTTDAIRETDNGKTVSVLGKEGKEMPVKVKTGIEGTDATEIVSGLKEGQTVVIPTMDAGSFGSGGAPGRPSGRPGGSPGGSRGGRMRGPGPF